MVSTTSLQILRDMEIRLCSWIPILRFCWPNPLRPWRSKLSCRVRSWVSNPRWFLTSRDHDHLLWPRNAHACYGWVLAKECDRIQQPEEYNPRNLVHWSDSLLGQSGRVGFKISKWFVGTKSVLHPSLTGGLRQVEYLVWVWLETKWLPLLCRSTCRFPGLASPSVERILISTLITMIVCILPFPITL